MCVATGLSLFKSGTATYLSICLLKRSWEGYFKNITVLILMKERVAFDVQMMNRELACVQIGFLCGNPIHKQAIIIPFQLIAYYAAG